MSLVSTTLAISCSPVSTTQAIKPCHGFSVIADVIDTGNKFISGDVDTGEQISPVTTTLVNNYPQ
jgi:hypothetical protein